MTVEQAQNLAREMGRAISYRSGKPLLITRSAIVVSANHLSGNGMIARHEARGILPGCRKVAHLTDSTSYDKIHVRNLYSYNGHAEIAPEDWRALLECSPVVSDPLFPVTITPEIESWARSQALRICDCPSVVNDADVCEAYKASIAYDRIEVSDVR